MEIKDRIPARLKHLPQGKRDRIYQEWLSGVETAKYFAGWGTKELEAQLKLSFIPETRGIIRAILHSRIQPIAAQSETSKRAKATATA